MIPIFKGRVENGKFILNNREGFDRYLLTLNGEVELKLGRDLGMRTDPQNKYLWGVVYRLIAQHTGHTDDEIHGLMGVKFRKKQLDIGWTIISTTKLNKQEFSEYIENIKQWAAEELGLYIPDSDEVSLEL